GLHADDFSVEMAVSALAAGEEADAILRFLPQDIGPREAVLRISSNDPAGDFQIILHGNGVAPVVPAFSDYTDSFGLEGEDALPAARPFPDGLPNLVRYAMNLSASPAREDLPAARILAMDGAPHFAVEFRVRKNMPATRLFPEFSANLQDWEEAHSQNIESLEDPDPETARFRVAFPLADGHRFIRFQATGNP